MEQNKRATLTIYPNPINSESSFQFIIDGFDSDRLPKQDAIVDLHDVFGRKIASQTLTVNVLGKSIGGEYNLTQTPINPGIYIVKITYKSESYQAKLIVQ